MLRTRQEELLETRLEALRRSLTTTDRVLSGRKVNLTFGRGNTPGVPAYSIGDQIAIELGLIPQLGSNAALVEILGLNYHELAHVRYGVGRNIVEEKIPNRHYRFLEAYRMLEESRIETLFAAKYAKMKKYFAYPVVKYFVKDERAWPTAFLYTHGRRYLPLKVRATFRNIFESTYGGADEFADIIDKYRLISFTDYKQIKAGALLVNEFAKLLEKYVRPLLSVHDSTRDPNDDDDEDVKNTASPATKQDAQEAAQQTEEQDEKEKDGEDGSEFQDEEEEDKGGEPEGSGAEDDSEADGGQDSGESESEPESDSAGGGQDQEDGDPQSDSAESTGDDAGNGDQSSDQGGQGDSDQEDDSADSSGALGGPSQAGSGGDKKPPVGRGQPTPEELSDLSEKMSEVLDYILDDDDVQNDVENLKFAMDDDSGLSSSLDRRSGHTGRSLRPVTADMLAEADRLKDVLRQIWAMMEPGWMYGLAEGNRVDMQRAALAQSPDDYDSIYADWQEGQQDNSGLEVVIVADESWSMCEPIPQAFNARGSYSIDKATVVSRQVWELKYALQEIEAHVTVISFSDEAWTMYDRQDAVTTSGHVYLVPDNGTNPTSALVEAKRIFTSSEMPNKLLVTISDGDWDRWAITNCPPILDEMHGVTKVAAVIDTQGSDYKFALENKFDVVRRTSGSIFEVVADAVTRIVEGNRNS